MRTTILGTTIVLLLLTAWVVPAAAAGPPVLDTGSITFTDTNPCTGLEHEVTIQLNDYVHAFELDDPDRHHLNVRFVDLATTDDGYAGIGRGGIVDNGAGHFADPEQTGMFKFTYSALMKNPDTRMHFRVSIHAVFVQVDGALKVAKDELEARCYGKRS